MLAELVEGDSHEFLLWVQEANKALTMSGISDRGSGSSRVASIPLLVGRDLRESTSFRGLHPAKRKLATCANDQLVLVLEPSLKGRPDND